MFLLLKKLLVECHAGSHQFGDSALDNVLCQLRVFQLIAHSYLVARTNKSWKICLKGMVGESRHRNRSWSCARALCQDDTQHLAGNQSIVAICFIKIAAPEQKHCLRMLRLHSEELLHHRCFGRFFLCHLYYLLYLGKCTHFCSKAYKNCYLCSAYEKGTDHIVLLAANRWLRRPEMGEVRQISAFRGMAAGDLYS